MNLNPRMKDVSDEVKLFKFTTLAADTYMPIKPEQKITHVASFIAAKSRVTLLTTLYSN